ncbi:MAG: BGTF surface domain-containing protein [Euryarchaeota archaeon]|nr:BGTF surface domain-containing protein [Euryarchaeota archaeon]
MTSFGSVVPYSNESIDAIDNGDFRIKDLDLEGVDSGTYVISSASSYSSGASLSETFSVQEQDFSTSFDDDSVTEEDKTTVEFDSQNRPTTTDYNVTVSVSGPDTLDVEQLEDLFNVTDNPDYEVEEDRFLPLDYLDYDDDEGRTELRDDDYLTIDLSEVNASDLSDDELTAHFDNLEDYPDSGEYEFEFIVADTGATSTSTIEVGESDESASFAEGATQAPAGDITEFEVELEDTDDTFVQIGGEDSDFVEVLYLKADDEDEPMTVQVNTRLLGTETAKSNVYDFDNVDSSVSGVHDGSAALAGVSTTSEVIFEDDGSVGYNFNDYTNEIVDADADDQLTRPLQPTDYEITAAADNGNDRGIFDLDTGEANEELASKILELRAPEIGDITVHTAPEESADDETELEPLLDAATARDEVALNDRMVVQVEATGIYGSLVAQADGSDNANSNFDILEDGADSNVLHNVVENSNESINFDITAEDGAGNQDPLEVDLTASDSDSYVVLDNDGGQFFVIVDTSSDDAFANGDAPDADTDFTATLEYDGDNGDDRMELADDKSPFSIRDGAGSSYANYPYLAQGEVLSSEATATLAPAEVNFDNVNVDDVLEAENIEDAEISGTTNVAPGSDAEIRVSSTDASSSFRNGETVNITEDGEISAEFDFSDQEVDDEFETNFLVSGSGIDSVDSMLVEEGTLEDDAPEDDESEDDESEDDSSSDDSSSDDSSSDDSSSDDSSSDDGESDDSSSEETPGFGAIVALVAVLGAALLATRRQN